ncbi:MAG: LysM peptidoglycan-binding domain-containing protein [Planctomycetota bacterium]|jgi:nucleoid-associated protein YgaU
MGKVLVVIVTLVIGLGAGFGAGYMLMMPRIKESTTEIDNLTAKLAESEAASEETLKKAGKEITVAKSQVKKSQDNAIRVNNEFIKLEAENKRLQLLLKKMMDQRAASTVSSIPTAPAAPAPASSAKTTETTASAPAATGPTVEYTVAEGDSLWKIAATELGNGLRYKDIIKLNPGIDEKSKLDIGMKLKLPAN